MTGNKSSQEIEDTLRQNDAVKRDVVGWSTEGDLHVEGNTLVAVLDGSTLRDVLADEILDGGEGGMTEKPLKMPRFGATFSSLAYRDRALREAGLHDEADAAARRFEAATGIDVLAVEDPDADARPLPKTGYVYAPGPKPRKDDVPAGTERFRWLAHLDPKHRAEVQETTRENGEKMVTFLEKPEAEKPRVQHTNRRTRRADAAKARRRSA